MTRAREVISQSSQIHLTNQEAEKFVAALQKIPKANEKLKRLFKKHHIKQL